MRKLWKYLENPWKTARNHETTSDKAIGKNDPVSSSSTGRGRLDKQDYESEVPLRYKDLLILVLQTFILFNISPWKDRKLRDLGKVIPPNIMPPYSIIIIVFNTNIISGSSCNRFYSYFYSLWCHSSVQLEICGEYCAKCGFSVKSSTSAIHISNDCLICVRFWQYQIEVKFLTFMHPSKMCLKYVSGKKK